MHRNQKIYTRVKSISHTKNNNWIWVGLLLFVLAFISISLSGCGTADAAVKETVVSIPDSITIDEAYDKYEQGVFFLDVRTPAEWEEFHAPGATLIPLDELEYRLDELPEGKEIVVVCRSGNRSQTGRDILRGNGFELSTSMDGGLNAWRAAGYPIE